MRAKPGYIVCCCQMKEDELERTALELEEYRSRLSGYETNYFPSCKAKTLFQ